MLGTIVNTCAIALGSAIGAAAKRGLGEKYQDILYVAMGLSAMGVGLHSVMVGMDASLYPVLFIASLAIGGVVGTAADISGRFDRLVSARAADGGRLAQGLSTAIVVFCFGALSILGPINSALYGDETYLFTNATLDFVTSMVLASTFGIGIVLAAGVLFAWQGSIWLLAGLIAPMLSDGLMSEITIVGGFMVFASGLSIMRLKEIPVMNLLPSLLVPPVWFAVVGLFA